MGSIISAHHNRCKYAGLTHILTAAEKVFQVDLSLPRYVAITGVGERAYVRFDHGAEPLASQWLRSGRQLLLSRLSF